MIWNWSREDWIWRIERKICFVLQKLKLKTKGIHEMIVMDMRTEIKERYPNIFLFIPRHRSTPHSCSSCEMNKKYSDQRNWKVSYVSRLQLHCAQLLLHLVSYLHLNSWVFSFIFPFLSRMPRGDNEQVAVWDLADCWFNPQEGSLENRTIIHPVKPTCCCF